MKKLSCILLLTGLVSCSIKTETTETKMKFTTDSIEYHGIGQDHSLQTTPYWRIHIKETNMWVRTQNPTNVGDSITILLRK
jgi:hypothetical protein